MCDSSSSRACQLPGTHLSEGPCEGKSTETAGYGAERSYQAYEVKQDQVCDNFSKLWKDPVQRYEHFTFEVSWYFCSIIVEYVVTFKSGSHLSSLGELRYKT